MPYPNASREPYAARTASTEGSLERELAWVLSLEFATERRLGEWFASLSDASSRAKRFVINERYRNL